ncbi:MAG: hypothetical protein ITG02_15705 [Patulibacter sp.]|nr:hypothetical protein [Patulibacter sp.]
MIRLIVDDAADPDRTEDLNRLHRPDAGLVVMHAASRASPAAFARELLDALGRPVAVREAASAAAIVDWAHAWLVSAPRPAQLVVYGAWRLTPGTAEWLARIAEHGPTVWLIVHDDSAVPEYVEELAQERWDWQRFAAHRFHDDSEEREDFGLPDWGSPYLPPFPWSRRYVQSLDRETLNRIAPLATTFHVLGQRLDELCGKPTMRRLGVTAAVARLALVSSRPSDLSVFCRLLEEEVFLRGGLLVCDPGAIAELFRPGGPADPIIAELHHSRSDPLHANPRLALADLVQLGSNQPPPVLFARDGSHVVLDDGTQAPIPPWHRWTARASAYLADLETDDPGTRPIALSMSAYLELPEFRYQGRPIGIAQLQPLSMLIAPHLRFSTLDQRDPGPDGEDDVEAMTPETAEMLHRIWEARSRWRRTGNVPKPPAEDPVVRWLVDHELVTIDPHGAPDLAPWLLDVLQDRHTWSHGPRLSSFGA